MKKLLTTWIVVLTGIGINVQYLFIFKDEIGKLGGVYRKGKKEVIGNYSIAVRVISQIIQLVILRDTTRNSKRKTKFGFYIHNLVK